MIRRLIILLLIVGCDRYEFKTQRIRYDKWCGNVHHLITECEEVDEDTMPYSGRIEIDGWKKEYSHFADWSDLRIYRQLKRKMNILFGMSMITEKVKRNG